MFFRIVDEAAEFSLRLRFPASAPVVAAAGAKISAVAARKNSRENIVSKNVSGCRTNRKFRNILMRST
jgi:hypothetical protein